MPVLVRFATQLKRSKAIRVLDLGAGAGRHTILLAEKGFLVTALDVSETALQVLNHRIQERGLSNVSIVKHLIQDLPFLDEYFDAVVSTNVIHHGRSKEIRGTLGEVRRVLKRGGLALIVVLSKNDFRLGKGRLLEPCTYVFTEGEEKGITHHFFNEKELRSYLNSFETVSLTEEILSKEGRQRAHFQAVMRKTGD